MSNCQLAATGGSPAGRPASARRFAARFAFAATLALLVPHALSAAVPAPGRPASDDAHWITIGADVFARAQAKLAPLPGWSSGLVLERFDEHDGVVLTRIPGAAIEPLSELVHTEFRRCGGFVKHESREQADAAMARLRAPRAELGTLPFTIDQPTLVGAYTAQVQASNILATITSLSTLFPNRYHGHHAVHHSADWIRDQWLALAAGRPDVTVAFFSHGGITPQPSVILTIPGSTLADQVVVLGGHQDSIRSGCSISSTPGCVAPGADDDASGVATLTEVIRIALANGFQPQRTIQFMAYAAEEVGLDGSDHIAQTYFSNGTDVVAAFQLDMTAYEGSVNDIYLISDWTDGDLNAFTSDLIDAYVPGVSQSTTFCGYACSDHASWNDRGFRAVFPFESSFDDYNSAIHTVNDTVATFGNTAAHAAKFARLAAAFLVETGIDGPDVASMPFLDGFETGNTSRWSATTP
jgi:leucyl aminopeptidase